jgi:multidrug transporter EmrE-like cation transporter
MPPKGWMFFALLCVFELVADVLAKQHVVKGGTWLAVGAIAGYLLGNTAWVFALRNGTMLSVGAVLFGIITGVCATAVGILIYHESVSRIQLAGLLLGIASIGMLAFGGDKT